VKAISWVSVHDLCLFRHHVHDAQLKAILQQFELIFLYNMNCMLSLQQLIGYKIKLSNHPSLIPKFSAVAASAENCNVSQQNTTYNDARYVRVAMVLIS